MRPRESVRRDSQGLWPVAHCHSSCVVIYKGNDGIAALDMARAADQNIRASCIDHRKRSGVSPVPSGGSGAVENDEGWRISEIVQGSMSSQGKAEMCRADQHPARAHRCRDQRVGILYIDMKSEIRIILRENAQDVIERSDAIVSSIMCLTTEIIDSCQPRRPSIDNMEGGQLGHSWRTEPPDEPGKPVKHAIDNPKPQVLTLLAGCKDYTGIEPAHCGVRLEPHVSRKVSPAPVSLMRAHFY